MATQSHGEDVEEWIDVVILWTAACAARSERPGPLPIKQTGTFFNKQQQRERPAAMTSFRWPGYRTHTSGAGVWVRQSGGPLFGGVATPGERRLTGRVGVGVSRSRFHFHKATATGLEVPRMPRLHMPGADRLSTGWPTETLPLWKVLTSKAGFRYLVASLKPTAPAIFVSDPNRRYRPGAEQRVTVGFDDLLSPIAPFFCYNEGTQPMSLWMKIDAAYYLDAAVLEAGEAAEILFLRALGLAKTTNCDGLVTRKQLVSLGLRSLSKRIRMLVSVGLWDEVAGGWQIRSFLKYNQSAQQVAYIQKVRGEAGKLGGRPKQKENQIDNQNALPMYYPEEEEEKEEEKEVQLTQGQERANSVRTTSPKMKPSYNPDNSNHAAIVEICEWFWAAEGREPPDTEARRFSQMNGVRLAIEKDMPETAPAERPARLRAALESALADDFWSKQLISLGGIRKRGDGDRRKWKNAESGSSNSGQARGLKPRVQSRNAEDYGLAR